jgi:hypothetical protein
MVSLGRDIFSRDAYLKCATESIHKDREEEKSSSFVKAVGIRLQVVEDTPNNQSHDGIGDQLRES